MSKRMIVAVRESKREAMLKQVVDDTTCKIVEQIRIWTTYEVKIGLFTSIKKLDQFCDEKGIQRERTYVGGSLNSRYKYKVYVNQAEQRAFESFMHKVR